MPFDVSGLANYTDQNRLPLVVKSQLKSKSTNLFTLQTGCKGPTAINLLNVSMSAQARGCGWSAGTSSAVLTQRVITPAKADFKVPFCPADLEAKWTKHELLAGALKEQESLPFEQSITEEFVKGIGAIIETAAWQGDTASGNANLNKGDGLLKIIDAASDEVLANTAPFIGTPITSGVGITKANVSSIIDAMVLAFPATIAGNDDLHIACGTETFRKYVQAIKDANLFHFVFTTDAGFELMIPGTNIKLVGLDGLNSTNRLIGFAKSNVFYGVDLENDKDEFKLFYSQDNDEIRFIAKMNYGFQVAFTNEIVSFVLA
jgi:hypothetical protein